MNYQRIYDELIKRGVERGTVDGYSEKHHILPRSLGGSDDKSNLVVLTAREHFIAHALLHFIHRGGVCGHKMAHAWGAMTNNRHGGRYINSRSIASARAAASAARSDQMKGTLTGSENRNYDTTVHRFYNHKLDEVLECTQHDLAKRIKSAKVSAVCCGRLQSIKGWMLWAEGQPKPIPAKSVEYTFENEDGRSFVGTQAEFKKHTGVDGRHSGPNRIIKKPGASWDGWTLKVK